MNGNQLITNFLLRIYEYKELSNDDFEEKLLGDNNLIEACGILATLIENHYLKTFIERIKKIVLSDPDNFLTKEYENTGKCFIIEFENEVLKYKNRNFYYSDINIGFASSVSFFEDNQFTDFSLSNHLRLWKQIEYFLERALNEKIVTDTQQQIFDKFFKIVENADKTKGIFINKSEATDNINRLYSYLYLYALNYKEKLQLDPDIKIENRIVDETLTLDINVTYEQYFDILDVLNEVNHTSDILSRFLKIYHVLEYLAYRVELSKIVTQVDQSKSFILKIIQLSDDIRKSEQDIFSKNFKHLFETDVIKLKSKIEIVLNPDNRKYISDKWLGVNFDTNVIKHYAKIIYRIRNSIAHNKESENHITISNPDEYRIVIPVIKNFIEVLQELIVEKISTNQSLIQYSKEQLKLY